MSRSFHTKAIVINRRNYSDADRFITFFSLDRGKIDALAKGVRKLKSRKRAALEPGNLVKVSLTEKTSIPIVTEAVLIHSFAEAKKSLPRVTQTYQLLEVIDYLTVELEPHPEVFRLLASSLEALEQNGSKKDLLLSNLRLILKDLGFTHDKKFSEQGLKRYIEELAEKNLRSKAFLASS